MLIQIIILEGEIYHKGSAQSKTFLVSPPPIGKKKKKSGQVKKLLVTKAKREPFFLLKNGGRGEACLQ